MKRRHPFLVAALVMLISAPSTARDFMQPQPWPDKGPWFEGWYLRVTDPFQKVSFAVIGTTATHEEIDLPHGPRNLPGYQALIVDIGDGRPQVFEDFPSSTEIRQGKNNFRWVSENGSRLSKYELRKVFPDGASVFIQLGPRKPWDVNGGGPAGWIHYLKLPLQWFVHSTGSLARYVLRLPDGKTVGGAGYAHFEKNWGAVFPTAWMWVQAHSKDNNDYLAIAGGELDLGPITHTSYMVGLRINGESYDLRPSLIFRYSTKMNACDGEFELVGSNWRHQVVVRAKAPPDTFGLLAIPTPTGYQKDGAMESFQTKIEVQVKNWFGQVVAEGSFEGAALEFGAKNMRCL